MHFNAEYVIGVVYDDCCYFTEDETNVNIKNINNTIF